MNWRTAPDLQAFLDSLTANPPTVQFTVTVVNVEPTPADELVAEAWVAAARARWNIHCIHRSFPTNIGYARACNFGASLGTHDVVALFNADVEVTPGSIDECTAALLAGADRNWGILGPRQVDQQNRLVHAGIFGTLDKPTFGGRFRARDRGQASETRDDAVTVSGSAYFVLRHVWEYLTDCQVFKAIDPGAEGAFLQTEHYYEETWCSYHAQAHGWKVVYYGPVCMTHKWHRASPVGGRAEQMLPASQAKFRAACDDHGIPRD